MIKEDKKRVFPRDVTQIHLVGAKTAKQLAGNEVLIKAKKDPKPVTFDGFSGRGVRVRALGSEEKDKAFAVAAKELGEDGTQIEFVRTRNRECAIRMLVQVTREAGLQTLPTEQSAWVSVSQLDFADPASQVHDFFTAKDWDVLAGIYLRMHEASPDDLDAILGKAQEVNLD